MTPQEYRDKLVQRQKQEHADKGKTGLGRKNVLDYSKAIGKIVNMFTPKFKPAENAIDIIPFVITQPWYKKLRTPSGRTNGLDTGDMEYKLQIPVHQSIGINNDVFLCPREAFGDSCSLCDEMFAAYQAGDKDKAIDLRPKWRTFYNVYDYDDPEKGIQIFDISYYLFESTTKNDSMRTNLIDSMILDDSGPVPFFDLKEGKIIIAKFKKKTLGKIEFPEIDSIEFEDRSQPYEDSILNQVFPLDSMLIIPSNEEMKNAYYALEDDKHKEDSEPVQNERPRTREPLKTQETKELVKNPDPVSEPEPQPTRGRGRIEEKIEPASKSLCPAGKCFGKDFNTGLECEGKTQNACNEETFDKCSKAHSEYMNGKNESEPDKLEDPPFDMPPQKEEVKQEAPAPTERRRRR